MIKRKLRLLILFYITLLLLSSCKLTNQTSNSVKYTITQGSDYTEFNQSIREKITYNYLSTEYVNYYFEVDRYTDEQKNDFINKVEKLRSLLQNEGKILFDNSLSIFLSTKHTLQGEDNKVFLNDVNIENIDSTIIFSQSISSIKANYGLCYGISCYINEKLYGMSVNPDNSTEQLAQYYSEDSNMSLMDLTIPTFQTIYFTEEQNNYAYSTAYHFTNDLINRKGLEYAIKMLFDSSKLDLDFDIIFTEERNIWLESIGASQRCEASSIPIRYESCEVLMYPYIIYTPSTISYFDINDKVLEDNVINYDYINHYLSIYEQDIDALKNFLSPYFDTNMDVINCYFGDIPVNYTGGKYLYNSNNIKYETPLNVGVHEYVHYITDKNGAINKWLSEGIAEYCSNYLERKDIYRMKNEKYKNSVNYAWLYLYDINKSLENDEHDSMLKFIYEMIAYSFNNNPYFKRTLHDVYHVEINEQDGLDLSYPESGSLINYLIETYGQDKFFEVYKDYSKLYEIYGKNFNELKNEWETHIDKFFNSLNFEYILGPNQNKIAYFDNGHIPNTANRTFSEILDGNTYEYVYCDLGRENDIDGLDLKGKIALIEQPTGNDRLNSKDKIINTSNAGAIGVIFYSDFYYFDYLENLTADIPFISISTKDGELLKEAIDKKITVSKDFVGTINSDN